jgi:hypothetical protein
MSSVHPGFFYCDHIDKPPREEREDGREKVENGREDGERKRGKEGEREREEVLGVTTRRRD